jgi:ATP-dependent Clp protease ATP-binding subunit ClpA
MMSKNLEQTIHSAFVYAKGRKHEHATLEHLLLALTEDKDTIPVFEACGVDIERLKKDLAAYLDTELKNFVTDDATVEPKPTVTFQRVLQRAALHVQSSGKDAITGANVLIASFAERESHACYFLQEQGMTRYDAVRYVGRGITKSPGGPKIDPVPELGIRVEEAPSVWHDFGEVVQELARHWPKREARTAMRDLLAQLRNES